MSLINLKFSYSDLVKFKEEFVKIAKEGKKKEAANLVDQFIVEHQAKKAKRSEKSEARNFHAELEQALLVGPLPPHELEAGHSYADYATLYNAYKGLNHRGLEVAFWAGKTLVKLKKGYPTEKAFKAFYMDSYSKEKTWEYPYALFLINLSKHFKFYDRLQHLNMSLRDYKRNFENYRKCVEANPQFWIKKE